MVTNRLTIALAVVRLGSLRVLRPGPPIAEADAQAKITRLSQAAETASADRDSLAAELERLKEGLQDLQHIQKQIAAATQELKHLEYLRARVSSEIDTTRPQPSDGPAQAAVPEETVPPSVSPARPAQASLPLSKEEVSKAQRGAHETRIWAIESGWGVRPRHPPGNRGFPARARAPSDQTTRRRHHSCASRCSTGSTALTARD